MTIEELEKSTPLQQCEYFIQKFESIPEELWFVDKYINPENKDCKCALGHCGENWNNIDSLEAGILYNLFADTLNYSVVFINDNKDTRYSQSTPKARILAALNDIKTKLQ